MSGGGHLVREQDGSHHLEVVDVVISGKVACSMHARAPVARCTSTHDIETERELNLGRAGSAWGRVPRRIAGSYQVACGSCMDRNRVCMPVKVNRMAVLRLRSAIVKAA